MQTTKDKSAGSLLRDIVDISLTAATVVALAGVFAYYKMSNVLRSIFFADPQDRVSPMGRPYIWYLRQ